MEKLLNWLPSPVAGALGVVGGVVSALFGGWSNSLTILVIFMLVDYGTGLVVAAVFQKSNKSEGGALSSSAGWRGLFRKVMTLIMVLVTAQLDALLGSGFIRDAVVIAYIANEAISLIENAGLMGVPIPPALTRAVEILRAKSEKEDKSK
jgi:toxin secretion/phage lysis holin